MAKDNSGDDGLNEASLDDFFQPPTEDGAVMDADLFESPEPASPPKAAPSPSAKKSRPKLEDHEAVMPLEESPIDAIPEPESAEEPPDADVQDLFGDSGGGSSTGPVEDLDFTDGAPSKADRKKKVIIGAAVALFLLLLAGAGYFLFGGSTPPPPPPKRPVAEKPQAPAEEIPPPAPAAAPDPFPGPFAMLGDLNRTPEGANVLARSLYDKEGKPDPSGRSAIPALTKKQFLSLYFGTYVVPANLEAAKNRIRQWGLKPIQRGTTMRIDMIRLKVAEFKDRPTAEKLAKELKGKGFDAFVIKVPQPKNYPVYAGSFFTQEKYSEYAAKLGPAGYPAGAQERVQLERKVYELWGGEFKTAEDADPALEKILKAGWNPRIYLAD